MCMVGLVKRAESVLESAVSARSRLARLRVRLLRVGISYLTEGRTLGSAEASLYT